jgi:hypothetical protein
MVIRMKIVVRHHVLGGQVGKHVVDTVYVTNKCAHVQEGIQSHLMKYVIVDIIISVYFIFIIYFF